MKLCICADPQNCTEVPEGWICKKDLQSPTPPVKGKLHICRWMGSWCVVGDSHAPGPATATYWFAFDQVKLLEDAWLKMNFFVDDRPPQEFTWTERQDPTRWG
jgi:hypothetical protein